MIEYMAERTLVNDQLKLSYEGLFNAEEFYMLIQQFFNGRNYDWQEAMNQEQITPKGKQIRYVLEPNKSLSHYYKLKWQIKMSFNDVKDVDIEHNGQTLRLNQGLIKIIINNYVVSDTGGQWKDKSFYWFLLILREKYLYKHHYLNAQNWLEKDTQLLHQEIKNYLNVFKYTFQR